MHMAKGLNQIPFDFALPAHDCFLKPTMILRTDDQLADEVIRAIKGGDADSLQRMFTANPGLPAARVGDPRGSKALLHVVTDWPGFFPNGPEVVKMLISDGADPNARTEGARNEGGETPLQWAASRSEVEVAEALILGGADIEARGGSIAGGTALGNAIGYGCWRVARLLLNHGAKVEKLSFNVPQSPCSLFQSKIVSNGAVPDWSQGIPAGPAEPTGMSWRCPAAPDLCARVLPPLLPLYEIGWCGGRGRG